MPWNWSISAWFPMSVVRDWDGWMLRRALAESVRRGRAAMFLAVDCENRFANALYGEFEFVELARRRVMLRHPARLARQ